MPISKATQWTMWVVLAVLLAPLSALAQDEDGGEDQVEDGTTEDEATEDEATEDEATEDEATEDEPTEDETVPEEPVAAAATEGEADPATEGAVEDDLGMDDYVPGMEEETVPYDYQPPPEEDEEIDDGKPFAKGDIELGLGLGGAGSSDFFVLALGGTFAYYVVNRLAPGIDINYQHVFSEDYEYPDSFRLLPFLKFVIIRSFKFAPYLIVAGGREFQWGGSTNPIKGIREADAWILGGGAGAHIGLGEHFALKLQLLALYYWYDDSKVIGVKDSEFNEDGIATVTSKGRTYVVDEHDDGNDLDGELFFPLISIGFAVFF